MRKIILIASAIFLLANACPYGWSEDDDSLCYKVFNEPVSKDFAKQRCISLGGNLAMPTNAFSNAHILSLAGSCKNLWLGIQCYGPNRTDCVYDNGIDLTPNSYYNFLGTDSHLYTTTAMYTYGPQSGKWFSRADSMNADGYICQLVNNNTQTCPPGYSLNGSNNQCYLVLSSPLSYDEADQICKANCGHVATPVNDAENVYLTSLAMSNRQSSNYVALGITYNGYQYIDSNTNQSIKYQNFGYKNSNLGNCVGLSLINEVVPQGKWINTYCSEPLTTVCRTGLGSYPCSYVPIVKSTTITTTRRTTTTRAPTTTTTIPHVKQCTAPYYFENSGSIYSPNYPNTFYGEYCSYIIYAPTGYSPSILFREILLGGNSTIEIYNSYTDIIPAYTIYYASDVGKNFTSTAEIMKVVSKTPMIGNNRFKIEFSSGPSSLPTTIPPRTTKAVTVPPTHTVLESGCNADFITAPGVITSPNYPNNYEKHTYCYYPMVTTLGHRIAINFTDVRTNNWDAIEIYDGTDRDRLIGSISGSNPNSQRVFKSSGHKMLATFITSGAYSAPGFTATFYGF